METRLKSRFEGVVRHRFAQSSPPLRPLNCPATRPLADAHTRYPLLPRARLSRDSPLAFHRPLFATAGPRRLYSSFLSGLRENHSASTTSVFEYEDIEMLRKVEKNEN